MEMFIAFCLGSCAAMVAIFLSCVIAQWSAAWCRMRSNREAVAKIQQARRDRGEPPARDHHFRFLRVFAATPEIDRVDWLRDGFIATWKDCWEEEEWDAMAMLARQADDVLFDLIHGIDGDDDNKPRPVS